MIIANCLPRFGRNYGALISGFNQFASPKPPVERYRPQDIEFRGEKSFSSS